MVTIIIIIAAGLIIFAVSRSYHWNNGQNCHYGNRSAMNYNNHNTWENNSGYDDYSQNNMDSSILMAGMAYESLNQDGNSYNGDNNVGNESGIDYSCDNNDSNDNSDSGSSDSSSDSSGGCGG